MNDLLDPFDRMLESIVTPAAVRAIEEGASAAPLWAEFAASGFLDALVSEDHGGAGLTLADVGPLWQALGRHAVPLPVAETMVARALLAASGLEAPQGPIAFATPTSIGVAMVPFGLVADHLLVDRGECLELIERDIAGCEPTGVQGDLTGRITLGALGAAMLPRPEEGLRAIGAVIRAAAMAGAAAHLLKLTVDYANERVQFGKPIGRQQALQQQLSVMAEFAVSTRIAVELACASGLPVRFAAAATAKSIASSTTAQIANTAHAIHGAIGISEAYDLQLYTRRLHEWRLSDGSEGYWNHVLGKRLHASSLRVVDWARAEVFAEPGLLAVS